MKQLLSVVFPVLYPSLHRPTVRESPVDGDIDPVEHLGLAAVVLCLGDQVVGLPELGRLDVVEAAHSLPAASPSRLVHRRRDAVLDRNPQATQARLSVARNAPYQVRK